MNFMKKAFVGLLCMGMALPLAAIEPSKEGFPSDRKRISVWVHKPENASKLFVIGLCTTAAGVAITLSRAMTAEEAAAFILNYAMHCLDNRCLQNLA